MARKYQAGFTNGIPNYKSGVGVVPHSSPGKVKYREFTALEKAEQSLRYYSNWLKNLERQLARYEADLAKFSVKYQPEHLVNGIAETKQEQERIQALFDEAMADKLAAEYDAEFPHDAPIHGM